MFAAAARTIRPDLKYTVLTPVASAPITMAWLISVFQTIAEQSYTSLQGYRGFIDSDNGKDNRSFL